MNLLARLKFKLAYYDVTVLDISRYIMGTHPFFHLNDYYHQIWMINIKSPSVPIIHCSWQVLFKTTKPDIYVLLVSQHGYVHVLDSTGEQVHPYSPCSSSYVEGLWDWREVAVQLLFCRILLPGIFQNNM